ncbi:MAG: hypothetical protein A2351_03890 [Omnitrophica bacterium RIFOXYB12_FULL_50_7]|nr:MAG: hypothetical protein A2351_03890 [Omnitrophica bacterium RIFOXYB12_FULL_50_7]
MKILNGIAWGFAFSILFGALLVPVSFAAKGSGEKCYTKVNIWYEKPEKILTTNYHKGAMLSVGSPVEILKRKNNEIQFRDLKTGTGFQLVQVKKYMNIAPDELFARYFSKDSVLEGAGYARLTQMEKENIRVGSLAVGMSREAAIMAYGYPPTHRTPTLEAASWTYWKSRFVDFQIQFDDKGKVAFIEKSDGG